MGLKFKDWHKYREYLEHLFPIASFCAGFLGKCCICREVVNLNPFTV
jgi:hypothetical protein